MLNWTLCSTYNDFIVETIERNVFHATAQTQEPLSLSR